MNISTRTCPTCDERLPHDCFRKNAKACVWCVWASMSKRAAARYSDKRKLAKDRLKVSKAEFIAWYVGEPDHCKYCGLTFAELKRLQIRRQGGYSVAWDIDRIDSRKPYERDNLALSCFVCNMAKGDMLSGEEARIVGRAVRRVWRARLTAKKSSANRD